MIIHNMKTEYVNIVKSCNIGKNENKYHFLMVCFDYKYLRIKCLNLLSLAKYLKKFTIFYHLSQLKKILIAVSKYFVFCKPETYFLTMHNNLEDLRPKLLFVMYAISILYYRYVHNIFVFVSCLPERYFLTLYRSLKYCVKNLYC
jgi:hypothetical protein